MEYIIGALVLIILFLGYYIIRYKERCQAEIALLQRKSARDQMKNTDKQRAVIKGQLAEQFFPISQDCEFFPSDMRFLGDFCDYICVDGYTECKDSGADYIRDIVFIEIKTGKSRLSRHQNLIRDAVEQGRVRWETIHIQ